MDPFGKVAVRRGGGAAGAEQGPGGRGDATPEAFVGRPGGSVIRSEEGG